MSNDNIFINSYSMAGAPEELKGYLLHLCHKCVSRAELIKILVAVLMVSLQVYISVV